MYYQIVELKKVEHRYKASKGVVQLSQRLVKIKNERLWTNIHDQESVSYLSIPS